MTPHDHATLRRAGRKLRDIREHDYEWTQRDVEQRSRERWGADSGIDQAVLSKIERGAIAKPPNLKEAAQLAELYDRPLSWIAQLYGLPVVHAEVEGAPAEPAVTRLSLLLRRLLVGDPRREALLDWVNFAMKQAQVPMNGRGA